MTKFEKVTEMINPYKDNGIMYIAFETARTWAQMIMLGEEPPAKYECEENKKRIKGEMKTEKIEPECQHEFITIERMSDKFQPNMQYTYCRKCGIDTINKSKDD